MEPADFQGYWRNRIERDLAPFADPGTTLDISQSGPRLAARWYARGEVQEADFTIALDGISVNFRGRKLAYRSFLACEGMADLRGLARMILQAHRSSIFVPTRGHLRMNGEQGPSTSALGLLSDRLATEAAVGLTQIVFVTGDAGAGKTHVLQRLVHDQAEQYERGKVDRVFLYINAQGRALSRFNEALATELQDLRSSVTYHAVASLVRGGVLVPIIDGFDELLGAAGYEDAFNSLAGFIEELDGNGQVVAAARSAYYQLEFISRANTESSLGRQAWTLVPVEIEAWRPEEIAQYVEQSLDAASVVGPERNEVHRRVDGMFSGRNAPLSHKPFFVSQAVELAKSGIEFPSDSDLLEQFVNAYTSREKEKLRDRTERPLLDETQLVNLMTAIAEEMWNQETRELDKRSLREIAEYSLIDIDLSDTTRDMLLRRIPSVAPLSPSGGNRLSFEHEMYFSYFLSRVFERSLTGPSVSLRMLLGRSSLPEQVAERAVQTIARSAEGRTVALANLSTSSAMDDRRSPQVRENAGILAAWVLRKGCEAEQELVGVAIGGMTFPGIALDGVVLRAARLSQVNLFRTDLRQTQFLGCLGDGVSLQDVLVSTEQTRIEIEGVDFASTVFSIRRTTDRGTESIFDPKEIRATLQACGALPADGSQLESLRQVSRSVQQTMDRLVRAYGRANPISPDDDTMTNIFKTEVWPELEALLLRHGLVTAETRSARGPRKTFLRRRFLPEQISAGMDRRANVPDEIRRFWDDVEARFPPRGSDRAKR